MKKIINYFKTLNDVKIVSIVSVPMKWVFMVLFIFSSIQYFMFWEFKYFIIAILGIHFCMKFFMLRYNFKKLIVSEYLETKEKEIAIHKGIKEHRRKSQSLISKLYFKKFRA